MEIEQIFARIIEEEMARRNMTTQTMCIKCGRDISHTVSHNCPMLETPLRAEVRDLAQDLLRVVGQTDDKVLRVYLGYMTARMVGLMDCGDLPPICTIREHKEGVNTG